MKYRVFIDGGHGTTGLEIRERLSKRDDIEILEIDEAFRKDIDARVDTACKADMTIMCLPDDASRDLADAVPDGVRLIDTSTAHRVDPGWTYGMPELDIDSRGRIASSARVANPGCHATGFILLARPLVDAGIIRPDEVMTCFCITGYSGGGRKMISDYNCRHERLAGQSCCNAVSPAQYSLGQMHKHLPEMKKMSRLDKEPVFCPVVGDYYRGMVMTVELPAGSCCGTPEEIRKVFEERYKGEPLIQVTDGPEDGFLYSDTMAGSDRAEIIVSGNSDRILLISRFDNLGKGASGAAVQNLNIMLGIEETKGLRL